MDKEKGIVMNEHTNGIEQEQREKNVWIDTDAQADDLIALYAAFRSEEFYVLGLSTVFGSNSVSEATERVAYLLEALDWEVPLYQGAAEPLRPLTSEAEPAGGSGLFALDEATEDLRVYEKDAVDALYEAAQEYAPMDLLAWGPLTNIARAIERYPDFPSYIGRVFVMIGADPWRMPGKKEDNARRDPEAANLVFQTLSPFVIPFELAKEAHFHREEIEKNRSGSGERALWDRIEALLIQNHPKADSYALFDTLALYAYLFEDGLIYESVRVKVSETGEERGVCVDDPAGYDLPWARRFQDVHFKKTLLDKI